MAGVVRETRDRSALPGWSLETAKGTFVLAFDEGRGAVETLIVSRKNREVIVTGTVAQLGEGPEAVRFIVVRSAADAEK